MSEKEAHTDCGPPHRRGRACMRSTLEVNRFTHRVHRPRVARPAGYWLPKLHPLCALPRLARRRGYTAPPARAAPRARGRAYYRELSTSERAKTPTPLRALCTYSLHTVSIFLYVNMRHISSVIHHHLMT